HDAAAEDAAAVADAGPSISPDASSEVTGPVTATVEGEAASCTCARGPDAPRSAAVLALGFTALALVARRRSRRTPGT
ncbi:hypothetical protein L6R52_44100, partial [Myxococcota bacterium]|nr:hypothetical protein [Myxococcota bacterium]